MDGEGKSKKELAVIALYETIGTAILFAGLNFSQGNPLVFVTALFTAAVLSGRLTGAHFNPAVTIAVMVVNENKKFSKNIPLASIMLAS